MPLTLRSDAFKVSLIGGLEHISLIQNNWERNGLTPTQDKIYTNKSPSVIKSISFFQYVPWLLSHLRESIVFTFTSQRRKVFSWVVPLQLRIRLNWTALQCLKQFICIIWIYCVLLISFWQGREFMFTGAASVTFSTLNCRKHFSSPVRPIVCTFMLNEIFVL